MDFLCKSSNFWTLQISDDLFKIHRVPWANRSLDRFALVNTEQKEIMQCKVGHMDTASGDSKATHDSSFLSTHWERLERVSEITNSRSRSWNAKVSIATLVSQATGMPNKFVYNCKTASRKYKSTILTGNAYDHQYKS